jgi:hypothetical protein
MYHRSAKTEAPCSGPGIVIPREFRKGDLALPREGSFVHVVLNPKTVPGRPLDPRFTP